jgi:hypothetical protein
MLLLMLMLMLASGQQDQSDEPTRAEEFRSARESKAQTLEPPSRSFEPQNWRPEYPNPAFLNATDDDAFWAAKAVMAFSDDDIRAIVNTGPPQRPGSGGIPRPHTYRTP